ncbi:MAG: LptA/OstA family protein [Candidatus Margulisiibacteriota bacterium]
MSKLRHSFFLLFAILLSTSAYCKPEGFSINADKVSVEKDKYRIEAEGNAVVKHKNITLFANHLIYDTSKEVFDADRGFKMLFQGVSIEGVSVNFQVKKNEGTADNIAFDYQNARIKGERIVFNQNEMHIKNASFTTCDNPKPHYKVSASDLHLYIKDLWLVGYWGLFWLGGIPIVPMPTYLYDFNPARAENNNLAPFPEIGSNNDMGNYVNEKLSWYLNRQFYGNYSFGYSANKGLLGGFFSNYTLNNENRGDFRLNINPKDGFFGGIKHIGEFGNKYIAQQNSSFSFLSANTFSQFELETNLTSKERINYQQVSMLPYLVLRLKSSNQPNNYLQYNVEIGGGDIKEEGNTRLNKWGGKIKVSKLFEENNNVSISPYLIWDSYYYSNGTSWVKPAAGLNVGKIISPDLFFEMGYQHYLSMSGTSPFIYELYRYRPVDTLSANIKFKIGETNAKIASIYFLDNYSPEDIDYSVFFRLHCYNLGMTYRSMRNEFTFGVSL